MKKLAIVFIGLFLMAFSMNVNAQTDASTVSDATAAAKIIAPIELTNPTGLDFGNIIADPTTPGTVIMPTTGSGDRSSTGGVTLQPAVPGSQAIFNVTGLVGASFSITLPADGVVSIANGGNTMDINGFNHDAGVNPTIVGGDYDFNVGAILSVDGGQASGVYSGTYEVTVTYE